ncbi:hypothetical protein M408DRAFT_327205 [Serendipita vermifera MAFF 305830]|uniref:Dienelactone hydrolase domain-containing protein n=1 Tax=Serendipita vermifera MAFF 305830 TaxID=933852 RepID=A0A0C3B4J8_SERVB|nr:hypothetical protein M408DRAFT_327205 [Serendipita vermifera MAFF 305830]
MAGICENCTKGSKLSGTPKGRMMETTPLRSYFVSASGNYDTPTYTSKALVIAPDIFGLDLDNPKLMADIFAEKCGIDVWVPDTFKGNPPMKAEDLEPYMAEHSGQQIPFLSKLRAKLYLMKSIPSIMTFRPSVSDPWLVEFITNLRKEYGYERIALNGYCWGGGYAVRLATMPGVIDLALPAHPSAMYGDAMPKVVVPITYFIAEVDDTWESKMAASVQERLKTKPDAPRLQIITYPGTVHGFGCRPNLSIPKVKESWEKYVSDVVDVVKELL